MCDLHRRKTSDPVGNQRICSAVQLCVQWALFDCGRSRWLLSSAEPVAQGQENGVKLGFRVEHGAFCLTAICIAQAGRHMGLLPGANRKGPGDCPRPLGIVAMP